MTSPRWAPHDWGYAVLGLWLLFVGAAWMAWLAQAGASLWMLPAGAVAALGLFGLAASRMPSEEAPPPAPELWLGVLPVYGRRDMVLGALQLVFGVSAWLTATTLEGWPEWIAIAVGLGMQAMGVGAWLAGLQPKDVPPPSP